MGFSNYQRIQLDITLNKYIKEIQRYTQANESYATDMLLLALESKNCFDCTTDIAVKLFKQKQQYDG
jgi:hypothetical protein